MPTWPMERIQNVGDCPIPEDRLFEMTPAERKRLLDWLWKSIDNCREWCAKAWDLGNDRGKAVKVMAKPHDAHTYDSRFINYVLMTKADPLLYARNGRAGDNDVAVRIGRSSGKIVIIAECDYAYYAVVL